MRKLTASRWSAHSNRFLKEFSNHESMTYVLIFGGYVIALAWGLILMFRWNNAKIDSSKFYFVLLLSVAIPLIGWMILLGTKTFSSESSIVPLVSAVISLILILKAHSISRSAANGTCDALDIVVTSVASSTAISELFVWTLQGFMSANA